MNMNNQMEQLIAEIKRRIAFCPEHHNAYDEGQENAYRSILSYINSQQEETVSEDDRLRKLSEEYLKVLAETPYNNNPVTESQKAVKKLLTFLNNPSKYNPDHVTETVSENIVIQERRCLEEVASTVNPFIDEVIEQFNMKDKNVIAKEIQYRGIGLRGDFGENIHRSDDEIIYILKEDKAVGLIIIRRTEFNNAEITMIKTEERFKKYTR